MMISVIDHDTASRPAIAGVVLSGGRATRMGGQDKGLLQIQGQPMVARICDALRCQVDMIFINANRNRERYAELTGLPVIPDVLENYPGPLAGIAAALEYSTFPFLAAVPCDSPFLADDLVPRLFKGLQDQSAEIAMAMLDGRAQPVFVLLSKQLLPSLRLFLGTGGHKIIHWYYQHRVAEVDFSDRQRMFENINTPQEQARIELELEYGE